MAYSTGAALGVEYDFDAERALVEMCVTGHSFHGYMPFSPHYRNAPSYDRLGSSTAGSCKPLRTRRGFGQLVTFDLEGQQRQDQIEAAMRKKAKVERLQRSLVRRQENYRASSMAAIAAKRERALLFLAEQLRYSARPVVMLELMAKQRGIRWDYVLHEIRSMPRLIVTPVDERGWMVGLATDFQEDQKDVD